MTVAGHPRGGAPALFITCFKHPSRRAARCTLCSVRRFLMSISVLTKKPRRLHVLGEALERRTLLAVFTVTTTADGGAGSLRQAILDANGAAGADEIRFDIAGPGVHTISPLSAFPALAGQVTVDATTQPGYAGRPLVELDGSAAGAGADGLRLTVGGTVKGLAINRFAGNGVSVLPSTASVFAIQACYIGVDAAGAAPL